MQIKPDKTLKKLTCQAEEYAHIGLMQIKRDNKTNYYFGLFLLPNLFGFITMEAKYHVLYTNYFSSFEKPNVHDKVVIPICTYMFYSLERDF